MSSTIAPRSTAAASATWRAVGGVAFIVGGALLISTALFAGTGGFVVVLSLLLSGFALSGIAFLVLSRGAAGTLIWGRVAFVIAGIALLVIAATFAVFLAGVEPPFGLVFGVAGPVLALALIVSAIAVIRGGSVTGAARWILLAPAAWAVIETLGSFGLLGEATEWVDAVLGALFVIAGIAYVLSQRHANN
jgi:hypothetical protein